MAGGASTLFRAVVALRLLVAAAPPASWRHGQESTLRAVRVRVEEAGATEVGLAAAEVTSSWLLPWAIGEGVGALAFRGAVPLDRPCHRALRDAAASPAHVTARGKSSGDGPAPEQWPLLLASPDPVGALVAMLGPGSSLPEPSLRGEIL